MIPVVMLRQKTMMQNGKHCRDGNAMDCHVGTGVRVAKTTPNTALKATSESYKVRNCLSVSSIWVLWHKFLCWRFELLFLNKGGKCKAVGVFLNSAIGGLSWMSYLFHCNFQLQVGV